MKNKITPRFYEKAQTASELAIFGAMLIFVLGMIVNQSVGFSQSQNVYLKAMRLALKTSYMYSEGLAPGVPTGGTPSRNTASIILVEDRLTVDSDKYGAINRSPQVINASGSHSRHLFELQGVSEKEIPRIDVFVNGKHFPLTTAKYRTFCLEEHPTDPGSVCDPADELPATSWWGDDVAEGPCARVISYGWTDADGDLETPDTCEAVGSSEVYCRNLYTIVANQPASKKWCDDDIIFCADTGNLEAGDRFDLDRDFDRVEIFPLPEDLYPNDPEPTIDERPTFSWQWFRVRAINLLKTKAVQPWECYNDVQILGTGEEGMVFDYDAEFDSKNIMVDIDGDLKEEVVVKIPAVDGASGVIQRLKVLDMQAGDVDFSISSEEKGKTPPGFAQDLVMYTRAKGPDVDIEGSGTYLRIEQGKVCAPAGDRRCHRSVQKKDQIDVVERVLYLTNNTGRFCQGGGGAPLIPSSDVDGGPNPVEVCCDSINCSEGSTCFSSENVDRTCMYIGDPGDPDHINPEGDPEPIPPFPPAIFVRSRIRDAHGRKWVTDITDDPAIHFGE